MPLPLHATLAAMLLGLVAAPGLSTGQPVPAPPSPSPVPSPSPQAPTPAAPAPAALSEPAPPAGATNFAAETALAKAIALCSPMADPADAKARDAAAGRLGSLNELLDATEFHVMWTAFDPAKGVDIESNKFVPLNPLVWAKAYLSMFMFTGKHEVRKDGDSIVVEMEARFRGGLPPGDFPQVLWQTPETWAAYAATESVLLVFTEEKLGSAFYKTGKTPSKFPAPKWTERWRWGDDKGVQQPRAADFAFVFSPQNPHVAALDKAYRALEPGLETHRCFSCHAPDNKAGMDVLVLLRYPNAALAARHALAAVLREETMPPGDIRHGEPAGIHDEKARLDMIQKADEFDKLAEEALKFETEKRAPPPKPAEPKE